MKSSIRVLVLTFLTIFMTMVRIPFWIIIRKADRVVINIAPPAVFEIIPAKAVKDEEDVKDVKIEKCESEDETEIKAEVKDGIKVKVKEEDRA